MLSGSVSPKVWNCFKSKIIHHFAYAQALGRLTTVHWHYVEKVPILIWNISYAYVQILDGFLCWMLLGRTFYSIGTFPHYHLLMQNITIIGIQWNGYTIDLYAFVMIVLVTSTTKTIDSISIWTCLKPFPILCDEKFRPNIPPNKSIEIGCILNIFPPGNSAFLVGELFVSVVSGVITQVKTLNKRKD